jgi:FkbM family methyltransferase
MSTAAKSWVQRAGAKFWRGWRRLRRYWRGKVPFEDRVSCSEVSVLGERLTFYTHNKDEFMGAALRDERNFYQSDMAALRALIDEVRDGETVLDIGANIGVYGTLLSVKRPKARIVSVEPDPVNFALYTLNTHVNGCRNTTGFNVALGAQDGWIPFFRNARNPGDSLSFPPEASYASQQQTTFSESWVRSLHAARFLEDLRRLFPGFGPHVVKIDTQGADIAILSALLGSLARGTRVSVELSPHHLRMFGTKQEETLQCLQKCSRIQRVEFVDDRAQPVPVSLQEIKVFLETYPDRDIGYWDLLLVV